MPNSETGVSILQSSPYIARNSITGQQDVGYGINLDNSNGTVEYNIVNNFQYSLYGLYSSPYLLKNTLSNASIRNIELNSSSIPVMGPLASGSTLYWLGGDNRLEGSPSNGEVGFSTEAFPEMDSGWNSITLSSCSNYMEGTIPPMLGGTFYATLNYWGDDPPDSNKFIIQEGTIEYDPWTGGEPPPITDNYQLNYIGFGLYDTVFTKSLGQSPSEDLFIQVYNKERTGQYNEAITLYKQVITLYRMSTYAPLSLSRIFNCAEKKRSTNGEYILFETYFRLINTNNIHSRQLRELAEDYVIRSKVRQGRLNDAIADYTQMHQQNLNTPKGQHALANKQSLERIRDNSYGGQSANSFMFYQPDNNQTVNNTPKEFRLYQNYPNPFNAKSRIKYQIAKTSNVVLQVFDASGKHVRTLINGEMQPGVYEAEFNVTELASGFFYTGLRPVRFLKQRKWL